MKKIILTLLLIIIAFPAFAVDKERESVYERVLRTGTIRCGYAMWTPVLYKDMKKSELAGVFYDLMEELGDRLDLKIEWAEEASWGTLVEGLHTGRYDMICTGLGHSSARAKFITFGVPVFYTPLYMAVKSDDNRFDADISIVNDPQYKIATLEGELSSVTARQVFPKATVSAMPQMNDYALLLKEVEAGKADATLIEPSAYGQYNKHNPDLLKMINIENPINIFPVSLGLPFGEGDFSSMINVTLAEFLNDGTVERTLKKHEEYPLSFLRVAKPYEAPQ